MSGFPSSTTTLQPGVVVPGIVYDNGVTDNWPAVNSWIQSAGAGAVGIFLDGAFGVSQPIIPLTGQTLIGQRGAFTYQGTPQKYGTVIVPTSTSGATPFSIGSQALAVRQALVIFGNQYVGLSHIAVNAGNIVENAVFLNQADPRLEACGIFGGTVGAFDSNGAAIVKRLTMTDDCYISNQQNFSFPQGRCQYFPQPWNANKIYPVGTVVRYGSPSGGISFGTAGYAGSVYQYQSGAGSGATFTPSAGTLAGTVLTLTVTGGTASLVSGQYATLAGFNSGVYNIANLQITVISGTQITVTSSKFSGIGNPMTIGTVTLGALPGIAPTGAATANTYWGAPTGGVGGAGPTGNPYSGYTGSYVIYSAGAWSAAATVPLTNPTPYALKIFCTDPMINGLRAVSGTKIIGLSGGKATHLHWTDGFPNTWLPLYEDSDSYAVVAGTAEVANIYLDSGYSDGFSSPLLDVGIAGHITNWTNVKFWQKYQGNSGAIPAITSTAYNSGTGVLTLNFGSAHGQTTGWMVNLQGFVPGGYNLQGMTCTVTSATQLTVTLPAGLAAITTTGICSTSVTGAGPCTNIMGSSGQNAFSGITVVLNSANSSETPGNWVGSGVSVASDPYASFVQNPNGGEIVGPGAVIQGAFAVAGVGGLYSVASDTLSSVSLLDLSPSAGGVPAYSQGMSQVGTLFTSVPGGVPATAYVTATNAAWPIPAGAKTLRIVSVGGGGQGGGAGTALTTGTAQAGAGGGGAGEVNEQLVSVGAATTLNITVGAGGSAGGQGGATGGNPGIVGSGSSNTTVTGTGGISVPASGGSGGSPSAATSAASVTGGAYGNFGQLASTQNAGGSGLGGNSLGQGGWPFGPGGAGGGGGGPAAAAGNGGSGGAAGVGGIASGARGGGAHGTSGGGGAAGQGAAGAAAGANTGSGGGGGGGTNGAGAGGAGGAGGSGYVMIQVVD